MTRAARGQLFELVDGAFDGIRLAEREFDAFLTVDRKLQHQQKLSAFKIAVIVLVARSNALLDLQLLIPKVLQALPKAKRGEATVVGG